MIVHLVGAPGSGKTTLAKELEGELYNWSIYDLDDLNKSFVKGNNLVPLTRSNPQKVTKLYQKHLNELVANARSAHEKVLFVGINAGVLGSPPGKNLVNLHADYHILLNVPEALNAQRWIQRDMPEVLDHFVSRLKQDVQEYKRLQKSEPEIVKQYKKEFSDIMRDFRPSQRKNDIKQFKKLYLKLKYKLMTPSAFKTWLVD
jgi:adenylate kinase family enzyme